MTPQTPSATATPKQRTHFNTYQQHFSPKKTAKPPTPTPSTPVVPDAASSLIPSSWPEIAALQTELLQLSLLHKSTWQQSIQWETDAEAQLRGKYDSVAKDYRVILDKEKESQRRFNGQALIYWLKNSREHNGQQGFAEQLQVLSQVAQEVYDIVDDGRGRYTVAILEFEDWLHNVDGIKKTQLPHVGANEYHRFIDPIDRKWKEDINALVMRLELASRQLQSLDILGYGEVEHLESSALLRIAKNLDELLTLMVEELSSIRRIEANIVQSETRRVSQLAQHLIETQPRENPTSAVPRTGVWR
jgi:septation ring formation regulator EzrA